MESAQIYDQVNHHYGSVAPTSTGRYEAAVAKAFGYSEKDLAGLPACANLGLSCGNPLVIAKIREGETVIDLGSGAGFDVFSASRKVGPSGQAIGVDMNKNMIEKANINKAQTNTDNVRFVESAITSIPLADGIADCIISNCVINLVPEAEKQLAFNEMYRLLKPGGRVAISDILARKALPPLIRENMALYVGCIAGASQVSEYDAYLRKAGFQGMLSSPRWCRTQRLTVADVLIVDTKNDLNVYLGGDANTGSCCGGGDAAKLSVAEKLAAGAGIKDLNDWAGSFQIYAVKGMSE